MTELHLELTVNGETHRAQVEARKTLADLLRDDLRLTGTHVGCEHGACGACTVLFDHQPVRSCPMFAVQAIGHQVRTIEGMAADGTMRALQEALWESHSFQCGFCTPGFVIQLAALLEEDPHPGEEGNRGVISGNLCRCTGSVERRSWLRGRCANGSWTSQLNCSKPVPRISRSSEERSPSKGFRQAP